MRILLLVTLLAVSVPASAQVSASHSVTIEIPRFTLISAANSNSGSFRFDADSTFAIHSNKAPGQIVVSDTADHRTGLTTRVDTEDSGWSLIRRTVEQRIFRMTGYGLGFRTSPPDVQIRVVTVTD